jgi:hypothetical protein
MTELESIVRVVASEIVNQTIWENYKFYLLVAAISLVSSALVAFSLPYLKRRGENLATKADFNEILRQLKNTTTLTESIKSDIKAKLNEEYSIRALAREKMEVLFEQTFDLELWLERARSQAFEGNLPDVECSPMAKIEMYQSIYFKELRVEVLVLNGAVSAMIKWLLEVALETAKAKIENRAMDIEIEKYAGLIKPIITALSILRKDLEKYVSKVGL